MRTAARRQERNTQVNTLTKTEVKKANKAIAAGDMGSAKVAVTDAVSALDKAIGKKILHKNNAARRKSRMVKKLNKMQAAVKPAKE